MADGQNASAILGFLGGFATPFAQQYGYGNAKDSTTTMANEDERYNRYNGSGAPDGPGALLNPRNLWQMVTQNSPASGVPAEVNKSRMMAVGLVALIVLAGGFLIFKRR